MAHVLIAGCGYVGTALAHRLVADGDTVFALRRRTEGLPEAFQPIAADLCDPKSLAALPPVEVVVYSATPDAFSESAYRATYVDGVSNVLEAVARTAQTLPRVLLTSSTSVYGQQDGEWVDENSPTEPTDFAGACVLEGERVLSASAFPSAAVRFGGIYGPGRISLIERVREGRAVLPVGPPRYTNRIHRDDCVGVLRHLMRIENLQPVYVAVDLEPAEIGDIYRFLAKRLGVAAPSTADVPAERGARRARTNKRCRNARLVASGYRFRYPTYREGYAELLAQGRTS
ncbi:MAG: SDR family oxidoreductase [Deltaproteobacteria bacterium]|nr:MAG: SDR family oxidoreductase [Deltaproteobacteria bacterium]